jgi:endonuclease YncB( thermonuclease family)
MKVPFRRHHDASVTAFKPRRSALPVVVALGVGFLLGLVVGQRPAIQAWLQWIDGAPATVATTAPVASGTPVTPSAMPSGLPETAQPAEVVNVHDGDTVRLRRADGTVERVRLTDIDAPEKNQPYGIPATEELDGLLHAGEVYFHTYQRDSYGRLVARLYVAADGRVIDVNREMVRRGAAWYYARYARDRSLREVEKTARASETGLWAEEEGPAVPPWGTRRRNR